MQPSTDEGVLVAAVADHCAVYVTWHSELLSFVVRGLGLGLRR